MKLRDCIVNLPDTGICQIDITKINKKTFGLSSIVKYHDKYQLYNQYSGVKIEITFADALDIIDKFDLIFVPSPLFNAAGSYMTAHKLAKFKWRN